MANKDKLITELANIVDEFHIVCKDFTGDTTPLVERAKKVNQQEWRIFHSMAAENEDINELAIF